uniref:AlNc14C120G6652 protein n=1 Tax=Albugo laibachii Nc14 TaxID=890382 RepID=F0WJC5_9STRA|nr:AlNc14C120G6652 [Albugo laibachii Nc14]|eukprot:CCA21372.1 AlNc14C120G6652 [Albugo laibachii Nc14]
MKLIALIIATTCRNSDAQSNIRASPPPGMQPGMPQPPGMPSGQPGLPQGGMPQGGMPQGGMAQGGMPQGGMQPHTQPGMMGGPETSLPQCQFGGPLSSPLKACETAINLKLSPPQQVVDNKMLIAICSKCSQLVTFIASPSFQDCSFSNVMSLKKSLNKQVCASVMGGGATGEVGSTGAGSSEMSDELNGPSSSTSSTSSTSADSTDDTTAMSEAPSPSMSSTFNSTTKPQRNSAQICVGSVTLITTAIIAFTAASL